MVNQGTPNPMDTYQIYEDIGSGGGGTVYKAFHKRLQKQVVIKKIHEYISDEEQQRTEVDILKNLHHPYLPQVFDYFIEGGIGYTVMDYIEGESLAVKLEKGCKFKEAQILKYAKQLCEALDYLHSRPIPVIHGDIKPDNIMITPEDNICLIDFNISGVAKNGQAITYGYSMGYGAPEQYKEYCRLVGLKQEQSVMQDEKTEVLNAEDDEKTEILGKAEDADKTEVLVKAEDADKTEVLVKAEDADKTEVLNQAEQNAQAGTEILFPGQEAPAPVQKEKKVIQGIAIDKRSDVYSVGATLFHLCSGSRIDKSNQAVLKSNTSDGLVYILNKALQENPEKRYRDAGEMLKGIQSIHKQDKRYKRMIFRQSMVKILLVAMAAVGILLVYFGRGKLTEELEATYMTCITEMEAARIEGNEENLNTEYTKAVELFPERAEAYYQKALSLYGNKSYEEVIEYIENEVLQVNGVYDSNLIGDIYYILGNSYFELEYYAEAENALATAIKYNNTNASFYVDHGIALARLGRTADADSALKQAESLGVESDSLYLLQGEIDVAVGDYENAEKNFISCIGATQDEYIKFRAYTMRSRLYDYYEATVETMDAKISLINEALQELPMEYHVLLLEEHVQACIDASTLSGDIAYDEKAIQSLCKIADMGWGSYTTYNNLAILYQKIGDYENVKVILGEMDQKFPGDYNTAKRYAFLEIELQSQKQEKDRNYNQFMEYYTQALELYEELDASNKTDAEMQLLEQAHQQLKDGHWLD